MSGQLLAGTGARKRAGSGRGVALGLNRRAALPGSQHIPLGFTPGGQVVVTDRGLSLAASASSS